MTKSFTVKESEPLGYVNIDKTYTREEIKEIFGDDKDCLVSVLLKRVEELEKLLEHARCPNCDGSGSIAKKICDRTYVTKEMAYDAYCPELEGALYHDEQWVQEQCQWCDERKKLLGG